MAVLITPPPTGITLAIAAVISWLLWPVVAPDLIDYNIPWLNHIIAAGPFAAFAQPFSNYNPPYLYVLALFSPLHHLLSGVTIIKLVSLTGTVTLAVATYQLLRQQKVYQAARWAAMVMVLPTTVINAAVLGQCDAFYVACQIVALSAALGRRHIAMLVWCGIAIAFKLQAIFLAPFIVAVLINRRISFHLWLIPPVVFLSSLLPAWALGWPLLDLMKIYPSQVSTFPVLSANAPNIWFYVQSVMEGDANYLSNIALLMTLAATSIYIVIFAFRMFGETAIFIPAIMSVLITAGLLPHMHERYFLFADIAAFAFAVAVRARLSWWIAILVQVGSAFAAMGYIYSFQWTLIGAVAMIGATTIVIRCAVLQWRREDSGILHQADPVTVG